MKQVGRVDWCIVFLHRLHRYGEVTEWVAFMSLSEDMHEQILGNGLAERLLVMYTDDISQQKC